MTRAWPRSRMARRIAAAAFSAAAFPNELLSLKTLNTISWLLSPISPSACPVRCPESIQELERPQAAPDADRERSGIEKRGWSHTVKVPVGDWTDYTDQSCEYPG